MMMMAMVASSDENISFFLQTTHHLYRPHADTQHITFEVIHILLICIHHFRELFA